jgi:hypothetical protein
MSLINQLLKDLEKSPRSKTTSNSLLAGLRADISCELRKKKKYYFFIAVLFYCSFYRYLCWQVSMNVLWLLTQKIKSYRH